MYSVAKYCLLLFTIMSSIYANGQCCPSYKRQPEFIVSYGQLTGSDFFGSWKTMSNDSRKVSTETSNTGADFFTARYFLYSCLSLGIAGGYIDQKGNISERSGAKYYITSTYEHKAATIAFELNYIYRIRRHVDIYTYAGAGPSFKTVITNYVASSISNEAPAKTTRSSDFIFHYCPVGVRVGGRIGAFGELGFGYKGLVSGGLSLRLGRRWCSRR